MADPIHQFEIQKLATLGHIGGYEIAFTNSALFMAITVVGIWALLVGGSSARALVPGRLQSIAELSYEFVADTINSTAGKEGMRFFPLVFTLFMFILVANIIGLIPYTFTVTSHIIITACAGAARVPHGPRLRLLQARPAFLQSVRAEGHPDLHPAADRVHRGAVVPVAPDLAQRASVRQHAGRPHHAEGVRELRHPARRARRLWHPRRRRCRWRWSWR